MPSSFKVLPLVQPRVNINGTSVDDLVDQASKIVGALNAALGLVRAATPHGRDFQSYDDSGRSYNLARDAWGERVNILIMMRREMEEYAVGIDAQRPKPIKHEVKGEEMPSDPSLPDISVFTLSVEPINRPTFVHGFHLGYDSRIAREIAVDLFRQYHDAEARDERCPHGVYTVALMRKDRGQLRMFDCWDGRDWASAITTDGSPSAVSFTDSINKHLNRV